MRDGFVEEVTCSILTGLTTLEGMESFVVAAFAVEVLAEGVVVEFGGGVGVVTCEGVWRDDEGADAGFVGAEVD